MGVSADRWTVRGVLLSHPTADEPSSAPLEEVKREIGDASTAETITAVLEAMADRTVSLIENIALTYHTVDQRRAVVTHLATGRWRTSSLVSVRAALLAYVRDDPNLDRFETILMLEVADRDLTFILADAGRFQILGSGAWRAGADPAAEALDRVRPALLAQGLTLDGVALCGSPVTPELLDGFERTFEVPAVTVDDQHTAVALGAARIAAAQLPEDPGHEHGHQPNGATAIATRRRRRAGVLLPLGAAAAALLAGSGVAVSNVTDDAVWVREADQRSAAPATPDTAEPAAPPIQIESTHEPTDPSAGAPANPVRPTPRPAERPIDPGDPADPYDPGEQEQREEETSAPHPTTAADPQDPAAEPTEPSAPPTTPVGAPDGDGLFPGESPPPPAGSDPGAIAAWWENHLRLQQRWLQGG
ncbi:hypothetical protein [Nocardia lijiangensis]|uniref:hypothetical protein n=1 Tax=Nocardia lijiangensis TaxID=299618 RepID=UPI0012DE1630|nr:hypothetical protein [Nocardia lijiangensis]